jgi:hypothetical protein
MPLIPFAEWRPDSPALGQFSREALNVVPTEDSYRPLNALATVTNALTARCQGAAWFRGTDGTTKMFAGDATKLYRLASGTTWTYAPELDTARNITGITQANPGVVTYTGADPANGNIVYITGVVGMTEVNGLFFTVANVNAGANTFELSGVNTTAYTAWSSGGTVQVATIYAPGSDGTWRFTQFGSLAIAVNGVDAPQKFDLAAGTNFADLGGSPPVGTFVATVRDFVVMGKIGSTPQRLQWSPFNNAEGTWGSVAATQADYQDLPDGGNITGLVGGEYGLVFSETAVRRMTYEGPPTVFRLDKISNDIGCTVPNSVAGVLDMAFFLHKSGFYMIKGGQQIIPIGHRKIDRTFYAEFDEANMFRCSSAIDPVRQLYIFAYPANGSGGTPNRLLIYDWSAQRFARAAINTELVFGGASQQSYTLEQLDPFGTLETLPYSLDSSYWTGALSLLLFGFDTDHKSGSFSGSTLEATVETGEFNPDGTGKRSIIRSCRPLVDGGSPMVSIGSRETQQAAVTYGDAVGLTAAGLAPVYRSGRYFRAKVTIPAGGTWQNMQGIDDLDFRPAGAQ